MSEVGDTEDVELAERTACLDREAVQRWMHRHLDEHKGNPTGLAEAAAEAFDVNDISGPLDDSDHWIWEDALLASDDCT